VACQKQLAGPCSNQYAPCVLHLFSGMINKSVHEPINDKPWAHYSSECTLCLPDVNLQAAHSPILPAERCLPVQATRVLEHQVPELANGMTASQVCRGQVTEEERDHVSLRAPISVRHEWLSSLSMQKDQQGTTGIRKTLDDVVSMTSLGDHTCCS
jgi:hypothetical protein